jgi:hypothetical protein
MRFFPKSFPLSRQNSGARQNKQAQQVRQKWIETAIPNQSHIPGQNYPIQAAGKKNKLRGAAPIRFSIVQMRRQNRLTQRQKRESREANCQKQTIL